MTKHRAPSGTGHAHGPSVVVRIRVQPRAARTEAVGMHGDALKIRVQAPPVEGAANEELIRFVASRLGIPRRNVEIVGGATARSKRVRVLGTSLRVEEIVNRLRAADTA